jgi:hypothetical protein
MITLSVITLSKFHCNTFVFFSTDQSQCVHVPNYSFIPNRCLSSFAYYYNQFISITLSNFHCNLHLYILSTDQPRWVSAKVVALKAATTPSRRRLTATGLGWSATRTSAARASTRPNTTTTRPTTTTVISSTEACPRGESSCTGTRRGLRCRKPPWMRIR